MAELIIRWGIIALGVVVASMLFPNLISYDGWVSVAVFALILGLLNAFVRPILTFLTCPLLILTLGLFTFVLNAILFWLAGLLPTGVHVDGFLGAFVGALVVSAVSFFGNLFIAKKEER